MKRRELFVKNAIESALKDGRTNHKELSLLLFLKKEKQLFMNFIKDC